MNYIEVDFRLNPLLPAREVLLAELADRGFESFVENENGLQAYIPKDQFQEHMLEDLMCAAMPDQTFSFTKKIIEDQNWNSEWEKNFEPIIIDETCIVRAPFHTGLPTYKYDVIIEPKMSFGTGHHATTHLIMAEILTMDVSGYKILDMGCGTGVLAILAEMRGAADIDAIDIDEWAFENTTENCERNGCHRIHVIKGGSEAIPQNAIYDVIFANINRNILTRDMHEYARVMNTGSEILFSGFYASDKPDIDHVASQLNLKLLSEKNRGEWCLLRYKMQ